MEPSSSLEMRPLVVPTGNTDAASRRNRILPAEGGGDNGNGTDSTSASAAAGDDDDDDDGGGGDLVPPLDERILDIVRRCPPPPDGDGHLIRPARLAAELGWSVDDASRELCGLLSAVGGGLKGASFTFETVSPPGDDDAETKGGFGEATMSFTFPPDFDARALRHRRRNDARQALQKILRGFVKFVKVFTAFGLIISLFVLIVAAICVMVAVFIAMSRGGGSGGVGHRSRNHPLMSKIRYLFLQLRQIFWLYAVFGGMGGGNQDPFLREVAGDLSLFMSCCCGMPLHPFMWFRMRHIERRSSRYARMCGRVGGTRGGGGGWGGRFGGFGRDSDIDGVAMVRRGTWGSDGDRSAQQNTSPPSSDAEDQRGLLSVAVEFLFGPEDNGPFSEKIEADKWKLRAAVITRLSMDNENGGGGCEKGVSLRDLIPYVDYPPASVDDPSAATDALRIVAHFNGRPATALSGVDARFHFPELMAEMEDGETCRRVLQSNFSTLSPCPEGGPAVRSALYDCDEVGFGSIAAASPSRGGPASTGEDPDALPSYLHEQPFVLTRLSKQQFGQCALLGVLNFLGVLWVRGAVDPGGLLQLPVAASGVDGVKRSSRRRGGGARDVLVLVTPFILGLLNFLKFYAVLFFFLPTYRFAILYARNGFVSARNRRRANFVRTAL